MKTKKLYTQERYTNVAVRAKLSVEVEQRKRLGAWAKRVLVLDGSTLYAYKTKGEGGSVGGWAVGGADVHIGRGSDSTRDDGRHILVISRPPAYKLTFSFNTTYEQARMIQALSSSGATVTGLDAIMLLKNLRKQQEDEEKEEEERRRETENQVEALAELKERGDSVTSEAEEMMETINVVDKEENTKAEEEIEEIQEIDESIYDSSTGTVSNPLYFSVSSLQRDRPPDSPVTNADVDDKNTFIDGIQGTLGVSSSSTTAPSDVVANHSSDSKVNPLPKPPRTGSSEGNHESEGFSSSNTTSEDNELVEVDSQVSQSALSSVEEKLKEFSKGEEGISDGTWVEDDRSGSETLKEEVNLDESRSDDDDEKGISEGSEEAEGSYEVNQISSDTEESVPSEFSGGGTGGEVLNTQYKVVEEHSESAVEDGNDRNIETDQSGGENYINLVSKMKLERSLSIDSQTSASPPLEFGSPDTPRKKLNGDSPDLLTSDSSPSVNGGEPIHNGRVDNSDVEYNDATEENNDVKREEILSDNEEKFEQLYQEISENGVERPPSTPASGEQDGRKEATLAINVITPEGEETVTETGYDVVDSPEGSDPPMKRVNSIIKKKNKDSPRTGSIKKVQFNLDNNIVEPLTPITTPASHTVSGTKKNVIGSNASLIGNNSDLNVERKDSHARSSVVKKNKKDTTTSPSASTNTNKKSQEAANRPISPTEKNTDGTAATQNAHPKKKPSTTDSKTPSVTPTSKKSPSSTTQTSPAKKKGLFSSMFSSSTRKASESASTKEENNNNSKKKPDTTTSSSIRKQPSVDLTGPLVIGGQVEMGGSVSGKLSARRVEVRDSHVVAFLPKSTTLSSKISLAGLSVMPVLGSGHGFALTLNRGPRCMMIIKLATREDMMKWINRLSDEVIRITPEDQRVGLTLYPSPPAVITKEKIVDDLVRETDNQEKHLEVNGNNEKSEEQKETEESMTPDNERSTIPVNEKTEGSPLTNGFVHKEEIAEEMDVPDGNSQSIPVEDQNEIKERQKVTHFGTGEVDVTFADALSTSEKKSSSAETLSKGSVKDRWKEHTQNENINQNVELRKKQNGEDKNRHSPLRRLSGSGKMSSQTKDETTDTVDNYLLVNNLPALNSEHQMNSVTSPQTLSNNHRIMSSSEPTLKKAVEEKSYSHNRQVTIYGSQIISNAKPVTQSNTVSRDKSRSSAPQMRRGQTNILGSPTHSRSSRFVLEPQKIEIIEKQPDRLKSRSVDDVNESQENDLHSHDHWFAAEEAKTLKKETEANKCIQSITWSVAATREKFELLCSVSGENKVGKLTTKTPISRKRPSRSSLKKRRPNESGVSRRSTVKRNLARPLVRQTSNTSSFGDQDEEAETSSFVDDHKMSLELNRHSAPSSSEDSRSEVFTFEPLHFSSNPEAQRPQKSPLRRTTNILHDSCSSSSSPEPGFVSSKSINRSKFNHSEEEKSPVNHSLARKDNSSRDAEVVMCWRGPYIAQDSDTGENCAQIGDQSSRGSLTAKAEAEQAVLSNISNAFLAKRRLLAREVALARIQEKLSVLEETLWDLQASMAHLDNDDKNSKSTKEWQTLERSLKATEEETVYWQTRLAQTKKEADETREKLAAALAAGLAQYNEASVGHQERRENDANDVSEA